MAFGGELKQLRRVARLTQEELAERTGYSAGYLGMLERGVRIPPPEAVGLLAAALELAPAERARLEDAANRDRRAGLSAATAAAPPALLPQWSSELLGREDDLTRIENLLQRSGLQLLSLTGPAGVGKTRLALEAGRRLGERYRDGVVAAELAPVTEATSVVHAIAQAVGVRDTAGGTTEASLVEHCRDRQLLLLIDNFEHVLAAAPLISRLLAINHSMQILVTSRAPLRLSGEQEYAVPPLALPHFDASEPADTLLQSPSVRLFIARARAVRHDLTLGEDDLRAVAEICRRLDGLPLAIELAAARLRLFPPRAMLEHLAEATGSGKRPLQLLSGGARDLPPRQRTLTAALDWSYDLLTEAECNLFRTLAVFAGGWTFEAAQSVSAHCAGEDDFLEVLSQLVDQSLVVADAQPDGAARYRMLEPIRQYALQRLLEAASADRVRREHARYYVELAESAEPHLAGPDQGVWLDRLQQELDNVRAALVWAKTDAGDAELGLRLATRYSRLLLHRGNLVEALGWITEMLGRAGEADPALRARALQRAGVLSGNLADSAAVSYHESALASFRALGDDLSVAWTLAYLGEVHRSRGQHAPAVRETEEAVAMARRLEDKRLLAVCLGGLADMADVDGDLGRMWQLYEEALAIHREMGNALLVGICLHNLGVNARRRGEYARAASLHGEAMEVFVALKNPAMISAALGGFAAVAQALEQNERAVRLMAAAERLREEVGYGVQPAASEALERLRTEVLAALGPHAFEAAWTAGSAMTTQEAIDFALSSGPDARVGPAE